MASPAIKPISIQEFTSAFSKSSELALTLSRASTNLPPAVKITSPLVETIEPMRKSLKSFLTRVILSFAAALIAALSVAVACPADSICRLILPSVASSLMLRALIVVPFSVWLILPEEVKLTEPFALVSLSTTALPVTVISMSPASDMEFAETSTLPPLFVTFIFLILFFAVRLMLSDEILMPSS